MIKTNAFFDFTDFQAAVGSLGTNATTLSWNVTLNLTVVDDRAVPAVDLTPMDGG